LLEEEQRALAGLRLASRLVLFRLYYLGGAEYHAAQADGHQRAHLGAVGRPDPRPRRARAR